MLFGDLKAGEIILVDVSDATDNATFTFKGTPKSALPDAPGELASSSN
jgi:ATP-dependent Clp protease ATP-binding subunit ClpC